MTDHLAALVSSAGTGAYVPGRYDLWLRGGDRLVHLHEAHHAMLTSATAWGAALLVASQMPGWQPLFGRLLDRCRTTHEAFATYLGGGTAAALAAYPAYARLAQTLDRLLRPAGGAHRRALAVTAMARAAMQTPVLDVMIEAWPSPIGLGRLRRLDVPDERFALLLRSAGAVASAASSADVALRERFGPAALDADEAGDSSALDDAYDEAWAVWEDTVFAGLAGVLRAAGATVPPDGNAGHLPPAASLVARVAEVVPETRLAVAAAEEGDERLIGMVLQQARFWLGAASRPARFVTVGTDVGLDQVVEVAEANSRLAGRANLVVSARLSGRLPGAGQGGEASGPVVGVRTVADDGSGTADAVWFARLPSPADVEALATAWDGRGDLSCCVAVSCLGHPAWRTAWLPTLSAAGPIVWLIDVGVSALAGEFGGGRTVHGLHLDLSAAPAGITRAVVFKVEGVAGVWLAVADELGVELITEQVDDLSGVDLRMAGADWSPLLPVIRRVLIDLLSTEPYLDLRGRL
ncbi:hypothetical protein Ade02nite_59570 [Paractinoplanes deccanensis]|uniref:Uncharacterized protein n=1 Tax=Paractinoplanes deccanensis TaxID=113561 RepID=A0ABQ3YBC8_9ACTN|nr:hypothetical protein [Actinoplanes deccanensis]GID77316.1 hypothetical protein Ade02nite_59570 [Actinoplanes deccanensis]